MALCIERAKTLDMNWLLVLVFGRRFDLGVLRSFRGRQGVTITGEDRPTRSIELVIVLTVSAVCFIFQGTHLA